MVKLLRGDSIKLEEHYFDHLDEDLLAAYLKAVPHLTIDEGEQQSLLREKQSAKMRGEAETLLTEEMTRRAALEAELIRQGKELTEIKALIGKILPSEVMKMLMEESKKPQEEDDLVQVPESELTPLERFKIRTGEMKSKRMLSKKRSP